MCIVSVVLGEGNVLLNVPFTDPDNIAYLFGATVVIAVGIILALFASMVSLFKYIMMFLLLLFTALQLYIFNEYSEVFHVIYFNLAIALIYINGRLILYVGGITAVFTLIAYVYWAPLFFPASDIHLINIPLGILIETALVLWAVTRIGTNYHVIADTNERMKTLLKKNEEQFELIQKQNRVLEQYANQIEQMTLREERTRMAKELHDTIGHTITSIVLGLEITQNDIGTTDAEASARIHGLISTARNCLEEMRSNIYQSAFEEKSQTLAERLQQIVQDFSGNTGTNVHFRVLGEVHEATQQVNFVCIRCLQESLTNALRHGKATAIDIILDYHADRIKLIIEDNGIGFENLTMGFGITAMKDRIESLQGRLHITSLPGRGTNVSVSIPIKRKFATNEIRVLVVDDQEFIRESFHLLLSIENDIKVVDVAKHGNDALRICEERLPDVVLMDIHMPEMDGVETTKKIKQLWPQVKVIILTTFQEIHYAVEAINAGAEGYLIKSNNPRSIADAIRLVYSGGNLISQEMAQLLIAYHTREKEDSPDVPATFGLLKKREIQVLKCLTQGMRYKEIAERLNLSEGTVRNYISNIYSKLEVRGRQEATKIAKERGII